MRPATVPAARRWADRPAARGLLRVLLRGPSRSGNCRKRPRLQVTKGAPIRLVILAIIITAALALTGCTVDYCDHYDDWIAAEGEADRLEMRFGEDTRRWPDDALDRWTDAVTAAGAAHLAMREAAPDGWTVDRIRRECRG